MTSETPGVDQIVNELLESSLGKGERIELLRELVRRGEELPDEVLENALQKLMERLTD